MIGFYNYTVILTYISLLISSVGIGFAATGDPFTALFCLMASGVCDMFDGMIARTRKKSTEEAKRFGIQLDSLCDIVCFGVLPAAVGIALAEGQSTLLRVVSWGFGALFIVGALIRLAYFNVTEEEMQARGEKRSFYLGLPITVASLILSVSYFIIAGMTHVSCIYTCLLIALGIVALLSASVAVALAVYQANERKRRARRRRTPGRR